MAGERMRQWLREKDREGKGERELASAREIPFGCAVFEKIIEGICCGQIYDKRSSYEVYVLNFHSHDESTVFN